LLTYKAACWHLELINAIALQCVEQCGRAQRSLRRGVVEIRRGPWAAG